MLNPSCCSRTFLTDGYTEHYCTVQNLFLNRAEGLCHERVGTFFAPYVDQRRGERMFVNTELSYIRVTNI
jgi:hypothetical protein